ncbi:MAG: hypothetical protein ACOC2Z_03630 [Coleofasciculus sp.]
MRSIPDSSSLARPEQQLPGMQKSCRLSSENLGDSIMKVFTPIDMTATSSLSLEAIQQYILDKINKFIISPLIQFWRFSSYYGAFITQTNSPEK